MNQDHARGKVDSLKGKAKSVAGDITDNHAVKADGTAERIKGAVKSTIGDIKDKASELKTEAKHKINQLKK